MSRWYLKWFELKRADGNDPYLKIPVGDVYKGIIDRAFPELRHIAWREETNGTCYTYFKNAPETALAELNAFLKRLESVIYLKLSKTLKRHFSDELDEAYALNFNYEETEGRRGYTEVGRAMNAAKYEGNSEAIDFLARSLAEFIKIHPTLRRVDVIAAMPARPSSVFHLPNELTREVAGFLERNTGLRLAKRECAKLQELSIGAKIAALEDAFRIEEPVRNRTILIIDDLYQSGASVWSLAKRLKTEGAREVYALACVKSWRDTDNQA